MSCAPTGSCRRRIRPTAITSPRCIGTSPIRCASARRWRERRRYPREDRGEPHPRPRKHPVRRLRRRQRPHDQLVRPGLTRIRPAERGTIGDRRAFRRRQGALDDRPRPHGDGLPQFLPQRCRLDLYPAVAAGRRRPHRDRHLVPGADRGEPGGAARADPQIRGLLPAVQPRRARRRARDGGRPCRLDGGRRGGLERPRARLWDDGRGRRRCRPRARRGTALQQSRARERDAVPWLLARVAAPADGP